MKKHLLFFICTFLFIGTGFSQIYLDEFDDGNTSNWGGAGSYSFSEEDSQLTGNATNTGPFDAFSYQLQDPTTGEAILLDITENNRVFVRVKASNVGTQLRMDVQDADGFVTSIAGITKTMTTEFNVLEFDFTGTYQDGGFGGTPCTSDTAPCTVDGTRIAQLVFFTDPGAGGFNGSVVFDYIAFGSEVAAEAMSDVFQDHFDQADSTITSFVFVGGGYSLGVDNSEVTISGDGTTTMWDPLTLSIRNQNTFEPIDIDVSGNNKMFIRVKSTVPGTALRIDVQDIDDFVNTAGSVTKIVGTEYEVIEYNYTGTYQDLGFGGTPCTESTAPCPLDPTRIANLVMFIEPGVGGFVGDLSIDYISFGNSLEPPGNEALLLYGDHFSNSELEFTASEVFTVSEAESNLVITGDGTAPPFGSVSYVLHDKEIGEEVVVDLGPAKNRVIINAKTNGAMIPLRIDVIDTDGFTSSQSSLTRIINGEFATYEYDFGGAQDGGFGGTPCEAGPCPVNTAAIRQLLIYPDAIAGGFEGEITIDFISIGQPLGEEEVVSGPAGVTNYSDQFDENSILFLNEVSGLAITTAESINITGDGTSAPWTPVVYAIHNADGETILANAAAGNNSVFVRARSSVAGTTLRVDLQDNLDFVTNANAVSTTLTDEFVVYELDYTNALNDGGFGGSPCTSDTAPCPVDAARIASLQFFLEPGVGMFNGTVEIDWVSFGTSLEEVVAAPAGMINYNDDLPAAAASQITDVPGLVTSIVEDTWTVAGDGTGGMWTPLVYTIHDEAGEGILANAVGSGDRVFVRARATVPGTELRMDLQDNMGFVTNANAQSNILTEEYVIYEYSYAGAYADGGFGGTPCTSDTAPCPVDGERVAQLQFFVNPGVGEFNGILEIDFISFGAPLSTTSIVDEEKLATMKAYPNPARGQVTLEYDLLSSSEVQVKVYDIFGKQLSNQHLGQQARGQQKELINMDNYTNGVYLLQLESNGTILGAMRLMKN